MVKIETGDIPCCVFVSNVEDHFSIKASVLDILQKSIIVSINDKRGNEIYNTDYFTYNIKDFEFSSQYVTKITPVIEAHLASLSSFLGYTSPLEFNRVWFQQYIKGNQHAWHRHPDCIFSNIYYVDLPDGASKTTIRFLGREFSVDIREGQIITFPSFLEHCSKPNNTDKIKTVISFNSN